MRQFWLCFRWWMLCILVSVVDYRHPPAYRYKRERSKGRFPSSLMLGTCALLPTMNTCRLSSPWRNVQVEEGFHCGWSLGVV